MSIKDIAGKAGTSAVSAKIALTAFKEGYAINEAMRTDRKHELLAKAAYLMIKAGVDPAEAYKKAGERMQYHQELKYGKHYFHDAYREMQIEHDAEDNLVPA